MTTLKLDITDEVKGFLDEQVARCGLANAEEYVQWLLDNEVKRQALLRDINVGLEDSRNGRSKAYDDAQLAAFFEDVKARGMKRLAENK